MGEGGGGGGGGGRAEGEVRSLVGKGSQVPNVEAYVYALQKTGNLRTSIDTLRGMATTFPRAHSEGQLYTAGEDSCCFCSFRGPLLCTEL